MIKHFLKHQWLQFRRAPSFEKELGVNIFLGILALFTLATLMSLAFLLPNLLTESLEITEPITFVNSILVYYFLGELFMRYFLQKVPVLDIEPYLNLPITRNKITSFILGKSLISIYNIISLLLIMPFAVKLVFPEYGYAGTIAWTASVFFISMSLHFFNILFKKRLENMPWVWAIILLLATTNYLLKSYIGIDTLAPVGGLINSIAEMPKLTLIPLSSLLLLSYFSYKLFNENLYLEELANTTSSNDNGYSDRLKFLDNGELSRSLVLQEVKLIVRHKRTKSILILSLLMVGYGFVIFGNDKYVESPSVYLIIGVLMSGVFTISYAQFLWSWNTNQMDYFFTRPISLNLWLKSRYQLLINATFFSTLLVLPYSYFGWDILLVLLAGACYNIGINIPMIMRLAMWGAKPIDLNKGSIMNYQGTGAAQWVMALPMLICPYIFYLPIYFLLGHIAGLASVSIAGIIGYSFRDLIINQLVKKLRAMKYKLIKDLTL
jgi:hypothetical protein